MKKFLTLFILINILFANNAMSKPPNLVQVNNYVGNFGYFLQALNYAKYLYPNISETSHIKEIELAYNLLNGQLDAATKPATDEGILLTPVERLSDIGLRAVNIGSEIVGYTFPDSYAAGILSGTHMVVNNFPTVYELFSSSLKGPKAEYNASEFTAADKQQTTYLACSYLDPSNSKNNFKIWAEERLIGKSSDLKQRLNFYKNTVLIKGRWILGEKNSKNYYVFGTILDPVILEAACIETVTSYAFEKKISITSTNNIKLSSGNTSIANSYPVRFYKIVPLLKEKKPNPKFNVITKKAYLLISK